MSGLRERSFGSANDRTAVLNPHPFVFDVVVSDGTQGESISASVDDKIKIARQLVEFGVDYVEAGWPGSNPKDVAFFERAKLELTVEERNRLVAASRW